MTAPMKVTVELDLDNAMGYEYDEDGEVVGRRDLAGTIVELASGQLLRSIDKGTRRVLTDRVAAITDQMIREQVSPLVAAALIRTTKRTNSFGEPIGDEQTLSDLIAAEAQKQLTQSTGDYNRRQTLVQKYIADEVTVKIRHELDEAMRAAKAQVADAVKQQGAALLTETIQRMAVRR